MRESPAAWQELRYEQATDADGDACDGNAVRRAKVLWALQYDHRPEDLPLVRWLAGQEARCRSEAPFQGLTEEVELAGFLLAEHRRVEDVWLHAAMKQANFDTLAGYDIEHLFAAGVRATVDFVRDSGHADRDGVLDLLVDDEGRPRVSEEGLAEWTRGRRARFPADPAVEDPLTLVERALLAGDRELARRELDRWAAGRPRDRATLGQLRWVFADLGEFAEAARAQRESVVFAGNAWDSALAWLDLAGLERRAGDHHAAREALRECRQVLDEVPRWSEVGLGRMYLEELSLVTGSAEGGAETAFTGADDGAGDP
ncbi:tetratricopeptide repeat protein [Saccharothrix hoggarensis]|uniref:Tol-pal system YbgF family protein n=1 Tax=Saccharothrix hoggarensis TaxID=913853 RepID=A0ABW3QWQ9_9PSEU